MSSDTCWFDGHSLRTRNVRLKCLYQIACILLLAIAMNSRCAHAHAGPRTNLTVSGISSGGYMAVQFHLAYSSVVDAVGAVAAGPYYSSQGNVVTALASMEDPSVINLGLIRSQIDYAASLLSIDHPSNLAGSNAWIFSGSLDITVHPGVTRLLAQQYRDLGVNVTTMFDVPAAHSFPTNDWGNQCNYTGPPYINNCGVDAAEKILFNAYPQIRRTWRPPAEPIPENLVTIDQRAYVPSTFAFFTTESLGLQDIAYGYFPRSCQRPNVSCGVHIVFHGCRQTIDHIGKQFIEHTGYMRWAESNGIILIYPQARVNTLNPRGCWDWWGYSGTAFATKLGPQMATSYNMAIAARNFHSIKMASPKLAERAETTQPKLMDRATSDSHESMLQSQKDSVSLVGVPLDKLVIPGL